MPLHYLNPDDEPRECDVCDGSGIAPGYDGVPWHNTTCGACASGRLGNPDAGPDLDAD